MMAHSTSICSAAHHAIMKLARVLYALVISFLVDDGVSVFIESQEHLKDILQVLDQYPTICPMLYLANGRAKPRSNGRVVKFSCRAGFQLIGKQFSTCIRGRWNTPTPICVSKGCQPLTAPINGQIRSLDTRGAIYGFSCDPGYQIQGSSTLYCNRITWNSSAPTCNPINVNPSTGCDFESLGLCGWFQDPNKDVFDWSITNLKTPSGYWGTGPSNDHTYGNTPAGHYLYIEASSPRRENDNAKLISPVYNLDGQLSVADDVMCFHMWYHMYGTNTGSLKVHKKVGNDLSQLWSKYGNQGDEWLQAVIPITVDPGQIFQIVIEAIRGTGYSGDTAIDDVSIEWGDNCTFATTTDNPDYVSSTLSVEDNSPFDNTTETITIYAWTSPSDTVPTTISNNTTMMTTPATRPVTAGTPTALSSLTIVTKTSTASLTTKSTTPTTTVTTSVATPPTTTTTQIVTIKQTSATTWTPTTMPRQTSTTLIPTNATTALTTTTPKITTTPKVQSTTTKPTPATAKPTPATTKPTPTTTKSTPTTTKPTPTTTKTTPTTTKTTQTTTKPNTTTPRVTSTAKTTMTTPRITITTPKTIPTTRKIVTTTKRILITTKPTTKATTTASKITTTSKPTITTTKKMPITTKTTAKITTKPTVKSTTTTTTRPTVTSTVVLTTTAIVQTTPFVDKGRKPVLPPWVYMKTTVGGPNDEENELRPLPETAGVRLGVPNGMNQPTRVSGFARVGVPTAIGIGVVTLVAVAFVIAAVFHVFRRYSRRLQNGLHEDSDVRFLKDGEVRVEFVEHDARGTQDMHMDFNPQFH